MVFPILTFQFELADSHCMFFWDLTNSASFEDSECCNSLPIIFCYLAIKCNSNSYVFIGRYLLLCSL
jgi:hypothetical protein